MTTQQVADRFYELSQQNGYEHIQTELYSKDAKSIEPAGGMFADAHGLEAIMEKANSASLAMCWPRSSPMPKP